MLAGLALLHTHHLNPQPPIAALSIAQQQSLATALELDFQAIGSDASWPMLLARHIVSKQAAPGLTPKKRRPAPDGMDGQIRNPGDGGTPPDPKDDDAHKRQSRNLNAQKSSTSLESSATSSGIEAESGSRGSPVVELMPDVLGHRPAFDSPIAAFYAWRWIATDLMEVAIQASYWPSFFTAAVARLPTGGAGPASPLRARG